jgi:hypothetical protein
VWSSVQCLGSPHTHQEQDGGAFDGEEPEHEVNEGRVRVVGLRESISLIPIQNVSGLRVEHAELLVDVDELSWI